MALFDPVTRCPWDGVRHEPVSRGLVYKCPGPCGYHLEWATRLDAGWVVAISVPEQGCPEPRLVTQESVLAALPDIGVMIVPNRSDLPVEPESVIVKVETKKPKPSGELADLLDGFGKWRT